MVTALRKTVFEFFASDYAFRKFTESIIENLILPISILKLAKLDFYWKISNENFIMGHPFGKLSETEKNLVRKFRSRIFRNSKWLLDGY